MVAESWKGLDHDNNVSQLCSSPSPSSSPTPLPDVHRVSTDGADAPSSRPRRTPLVHGTGARSVMQAPSTWPGWGYWVGRFGQVRAILNLGRFGQVHCEPGPNLARTCPSQTKFWAGSSQVQAVGTQVRAGSGTHLYLWTLSVVPRAFNVQILINGNHM